MQLILRKFKKYTKFDLTTHLSIERRKIRLIEGNEYVVI
jgi:hypothetical protein